MKKKRWGGEREETEKQSITFLPSMVPLYISTRGRELVENKGKQLKEKNNLLNVQVT